MYVKSDVKHLYPELQCSVWIIVFTVPRRYNKLSGMVTITTKIFRSKVTLRRICCRTFGI